MFIEIKDWLNAQSISFKEVHHKPTLTSEASALARGEDLSTGGKALVMKVNKTFHIFVISAAKRVDSSAIRKYFNAKKLRFANADELFELTGLVPGSVPPFGRPFIDMNLYLDHSITHNKKIAFNAGSLTNSIIMPVEEYLKVAKAEVFNFSKD